MFSESNDLGSCISDSDAIGLLELVHGSLSCKEEEDYRALFPRLKKLFPFDFAHAMLGYQDNEKGIVITHTLNISFPKGWLSEFNSRNYMQVDIVVRDNFLHFKPQHWAETKRKLNEKKEIISLCEDYGMSDGYSHGSRPMLAGQHGSMFCFSGPSVVYDRRSETILEIIVPHLHLALSAVSRVKQMGTGDIHFSAREKEVLNWLKQGKSSWDISVILGISQSTVNFHVYNVMNKLGATNRPQAVAVATHMGIIAPA